MPYAFTLSTTLPASALEIYDAWLDSLAHSEMTGSKASMSDEIDAEVSAWDGYISGRNLELVPGERIVQSWRTTQFADDHEDSVITVLLEPVEGGTLLTLVHSNVPDDQTSYEQGGWQEHYFEPMQAYFAEARELAEAEPETAVPKPRRTRRTAARKSKARVPAAKTAAGKKAVGKKAAKKASTKTAASKKAAGKKAASKKASGKKAAGKKKSKRSANPKAATKRAKTAKKRASKTRGKRGR